MSEYIAPKFLSPSFTCPYCNSVSTMTWKEMMLYQEIHPQIFNGTRTSSSGFVSAICHNHICCRRSVWRVTKEENISVEPNVTTISPVEAEMIYPISGIAPPPAMDMPESAKIDYNEAALIFKLSPKSASALLRLAAQKIFIELEKKHNVVGDKNKKENLGAIIKAFYENGIISKNHEDNANALRLTGNNVVHPGKLSDEEIIEIVPELFDFINDLVEYLITRPKISAGINKKLRKK